MDQLIKEFETVYTQKTKHRAKCRVCNRLIQDGETVNMARIRHLTINDYSGGRYVSKWVFKHIDC